MIVERDCKMCGTHFRRSISRNRKNLVAFCSRVCKDMGNAEKLRKVGVATFWDKIERGDGCWLWPHYRDSDGYGVIWHWLSDNLLSSRASERCSAMDAAAWVIPGCNNKATCAEAFARAYLGLPTPKKWR